MHATAGAPLPDAHSDDPAFPFQPSTALKVSIAALLLVVVTLVLYDPVKTFQFINYDDNVYLSMPVVQGLTWSNVQWSFTSFYAANWHPVTWLSHMLDCQLFGPNPGGAHYVNVLFHAANAALIFVLLHTATRRFWRSLMVAAFFALHPLNVGSVAWVAERKNMLSSLFWWLAIAAYGRYARNPGWRRYLLVALMFALGLMAKPMVITLPLVLLLLDYWPLERFRNWNGFRPLIVEKIPLLLLCPVSAVLTILAQHSGGAVRNVTDFPLTARLANAVFSYAAYLHKTVWPTRLAIFYPHPGSLLPRWQVLISALLLIAITWIAFRFRRSSPVLLVGWLWYLITLLPVIGIIQVGDQAMADRYAYLPLIGIFVAAVWLAADLAVRWPIRSWALLALCIVLLSACFADSRVQLRPWHDSISVWSHGLWVTGDNFITDTNLGQAWRTAGRADQSVPYFYQTVRLSPDSVAAHHNLGTALLESGDAENAILQFQIALKYERPENKELLSRTKFRLGQALFQLDRLPEAEAELKDAHRINPSDYEVGMQLGWTQQKLGKVEAAMTAFEDSIAVLPTDFAYLHLGQCFEQEGRLGDAADAYQKGLDISTSSPNTPEIQRRLIAVRRAMNSRSSRHAN